MKAKIPQFWTVRHCSLWELAVERTKVFIEEFKDLDDPDETMDEMIERMARSFDVDPVKLKEAVK